MWRARNMVISRKLWLTAILIFSTVLLIWLGQTSLIRQQDNEKINIEKKPNNNNINTIVTDYNDYKYNPRIPQNPEEKIYYNILNPLCEPQPDTMPAQIHQIFFTESDTNEKVDFNNGQSLKDFCKPYVYARIHLQTGWNSKESCAIDSRKRGRDCFWYHMCIWPSDQDTYISKAIAEGALWEMELMFLSQKILKKSSPGIVFDVGANIGQYLLLSAALENIVFAFEPIPDHVEMMRRSVILNGFQDRVHIFRNGIADYSSTVNINLHKTNKGGSTIDRLNSTVDESQTDNRFQSRVAIDLITFNDMLPVVNEMYPDVPIIFMKSDIEGYEPRMFRGGFKFFAQKKIPIILLELLGKSFERTKCSLEEYVLSFERMGYHVFGFGRALKGKDIDSLVIEYDTPEKLKPLTVDFILEHNTSVSPFNGKYTIF